MSTESGAQPVRLRDLGTRLRRRWRVLLASVLVTTIAAIAVGLSMPVRYTATSTLVVAPLVSDPAVSQQPSTIDIDTEREVMRSTEVADRATEELRDPEARPILLTSTDVAAPTGTQLLRVSVTADDPQRAARYSIAMAEAYLALRQERAAAAVDRYTRTIDAEIGRLSASDSGDASRWINTLLERRQNASVLTSYPGSIIGEAVPPSSPSSLGFPAFLAAGLVGGLLLGVVIVLVRDRSDKRLHHAERFAELTDSSPLVLNGVEDREALRWLVREVDAVKAPEELPRVVGVVTVGGSSGPEFARAVADTLEASGRLVVRADASGRDQRTIDLGWPTRRYKEESWAGATAVLDFGGVDSWTTLARLAERCDVVIVIVTPRTATEELREAWFVLGDAAPALIPVFVAPHRKRKKTAVLAPGTLGQTPRSGSPLAASVRRAGAEVDTDVTESVEPVASRRRRQQRVPVAAATVVEPARRNQESG